MSITSIKIKNIKSIKNVELSFKPNQCAGWHVIIGDNGAGKSTVAKAIALALIGEKEALGLREDWNNWLRQKCTRGEVVISVSGKKKDHDCTYGVVFKRVSDNEGSNNSNKNAYRVKLEPVPGSFEVPSIFCASYGPFRRFRGGSKETEKLLRSSYARHLPHLSLFGEDFALSESLEWIEDLRFKQLEKKKEGKILPLLKEFINKGHLLPGGAIFKEVSSDGVVFKDPNGSNLFIDELSDGYRSILSLTLDLIRQMVGFFGIEEVFISQPENNMRIDRPGVVVIDEIDAHLHPSWQKDIGYWLTRYFPKIQFIVTTHSPLVCRAAEKGSVWRLASPGSDQKSGRVEGTDLQRLLYGNIVEAMDTELFGTDVIRSETSKKKLTRLEKLNTLSLEGEITNDQEKELHSLRATMPTSINAGINRGGLK